jgi:hypothetical protein
MNTVVNFERIKAILNRESNLQMEAYVASKSWCPNTELDFATGKRKVTSDLENALRLEPEVTAPLFLRRRRRTIL